MLPPLNCLAFIFFGDDIQAGCRHPRSNVGCCHPRMSPPFLGSWMSPPSDLSCFLPPSEVGCRHPRSEVGCCHPQKLDVATLGCRHPQKSDIATLGCCHPQVRCCHPQVGCRSCSLITWPVIVDLMFLTLTKVINFSCIETWYVFTVIFPTVFFLFSYRFWGRTYFQRPSPLTINYGNLINVLSLLPITVNL